MIESSFHGEPNFSCPWPTSFNSLDQRNNSQVRMISPKNTAGHLFHKLQSQRIIPHLRKQTRFRQHPWPMVRNQFCSFQCDSPDQMIAVQLYMIGFVDDTSSSTNDFLLPEPAPLHHYSNLATHYAQQ